MRSIPFLILVFLATSSFIAPPDPRAPIHATPVMLDPADPGRVRVGKLRFLAGWRLTSDQKRFGGISALRVDKDRVLALSDTGAVIRFTLGRDGRVTDTRFSLLPGGPGTGRKKADRDVEAMATDPRTGRIWLTLERHNAIWRYDSGLTRAQAHVAPRAMRDWPWNGGPEAIARLADGRFIVMCEAAVEGTNLHESLLFQRDSTRAGPPIRFRYQAPRGFAVTDAAQLPDGRLLVLHRSYSLAEGVKAALAIFDAAGIRAGAVIQGELIARFEAPLTIDNMEGLSIESSGGRTILWLASDDNFNPLQRTLLMKFVLER